MKVPKGLELGAATHTGKVRKANEDDFLLCGCPDGSLLVILADGMGGAHGGAEASRLAARTVASAILARPGTAEERMRGAYGAACRAVYERSLGSPLLRDMGTTLTTAWLRVASSPGDPPGDPPGGDQRSGQGPAEDQAWIGHVGDTRALLWRGGGLLQLTDDHAVRGAESYLTRCVGGGQESENPDVFSQGLRPGDRLVLATDGVWGVIDPSQLKSALGEASPQAAAEAMVAKAVTAGGPDNATVLVVDRLHQGAGSQTGGSQGAGVQATHEQRLPHGEVIVRDVANKSPPALSRPRWPWFAWFLAIALLALVGAREWAGWDPLRQWLRGVLAGG